MPASFSGPSCERCSRPGHNPPVVTGGMCANCLRACSPVERAVAELEAQDRYDEAASRFEDEALAELQALLRQVEGGC